jgi:hypothetical protein
MENFPFLDQICHCSHYVFNGDGGINAVLIKEINSLDVETF